MYFPYLRGKQYELSALRATLGTTSNLTTFPIIEPVKENLSSLTKCLEAFDEASRNIVAIVNPDCGGQISPSDPCISDLILDGFTKSSVSVGILLKSHTTFDEILGLINKHNEQKIYFIHSGFMDPGSLIDYLGDSKQNHIFIDNYHTSAYYNKFSGFKALIRDGFKRKSRNADFPELEHFSDLHANYQNLQLDGFGDFLIVGDHFTPADRGGQASTVAIHMSHLNESDMFVYHFLSDDQLSPGDAPAKFLQALGHLINKVSMNNPALLKTNGYLGFLDYYQRKHFPNLGKVKELSMIHHIEVLNNFLISSSTNP